MATILNSLFLKMSELYANYHIPRRKNIDPPQCLSDPELGEHKYVYCNSMRIHYVESGQAGHPVLIFIHGMPDTWYSWRFQLLHFKKNYRVIAMDLRGCGESSKPAGVSNMHIKLLIDDIRALVHELKIDKFTLISHDLPTGLLAYSYAGVYPETLNKLIVCDAPHPGTWKKEIFNGPLLTRLSLSLWMGFVLCPFLTEWSAQLLGMKMFSSYRLRNYEQLNENPEDVKSVFMYYFHSFADWNRVINFYRSFYNHGMEFVDEYSHTIHNIPAQTLSVYGDQDVYVNLIDGMKTEKYMKDFQFQVFKGVKSYCMLEEPVKFNKILDKFLKTH